RTYTVAPVSRPICSARVCADLFSSVGVASIATRIRSYMVLPPISGRRGDCGGNLVRTSLRRWLDAHRVQFERATGDRHQQRQQDTQKAEPRQQIEDRVEGEPTADQQAAQQGTANATEAAEPRAPGYPGASDIGAIVVGD